ncbi:MAG: amidase [Dehalococcoidia bacterium]|nr:amidase [Dehalococcoidia bacterium]
MTDEIVTWSAAELGRRIAARDVSSLEATRAYLARIERVDPLVNAYITVTAERALEDAARADAELAHGLSRGPLHGVPIALKDLYATAGIRTTAGSKVLESWIPEADCTAARLLREAGTVLLGKLNTHEFAAGYTTENPWYGPTRNPWNRDRIPGGSSGGSGAAIAAQLAAATLGTDTGGSIRVPAAFCGCVGLKPTFGRVSKAGVVPLSFVFDHAGPIVATVEDAAVVLDAIAGYDPADATTVRTPVDAYTAQLGAGVRGLRVGVPRADLFEGIEDEVAEALEVAIAVVRGLGADVREVALPGVQDVVRAWSPIATAEVIEYHRPDYERAPESYSPGLASWVASPPPDSLGVAAAWRTVRAFSEELRGLLESVDVLLTPAAPIEAPPIGRATYRVRDRELSGNAALGRFMMPFNAAGVPALVQPCGVTGSGLPVGMQWVGRPFDEATVLRAGAAFEGATDWHRRRPDLG